MEEGLNTATQEPKKRRSRNRAYTVKVALDASLLAWLKRNAAEHERELEQEIRYHCRRAQEAARAAEEAELLRVAAASNEEGAK